MNDSISEDPPLQWTCHDIEQRLLFPGGRHTAVNNALAVLLGLFLTLLFYGALLPIQDQGEQLPVEQQMLKDGEETTKKSEVDRAVRLKRMFMSEGPIPYAIVFFSAWSAAILFIKSRKLQFQRKALLYDVVPTDPDFVLSAANVDQVVDQVYRTVDEPKHFVLYNRIAVALANLRNLGRVGDVDEILKSQAENDEAASDSSYNVLGGFIWAIPVLGFIGTVLGLSDAIGGFSGVLQTGADMEAIKGELVEVTDGLSQAFVTTLQALVAALIIQLCQTFLRKSEQEFLDECGRYCTDKVVNKLRIMPFERTIES